MIGMTKSIAAEVASRGITVNCVAPGMITTAMTDKLTEEQRARLRGGDPGGPVRRARTTSPPPSSIWPAPRPPMSPVKRLHVNGGMAMV